MRSARNWFLAVAGIIAVIVVTAAVWASADPDGLERVAEDLGFLPAGEGPAYEILPDYTVPGLDGALSTIVAGLIGVVAVFVVAYLLGQLVHRRRRNEEPTGS